MCLHHGSDEISPFNLDESGGGHLALVTMVVMVIVVVVIMVVVLTVVMVVGTMMHTRERGKWRWLQW